MNDELLMEYDHRIALDQAQYVRLDGDAAFYNVDCPHVLVSCFVILTIIVLPVHKIIKCYLNYILIRCTDAFFI